MWPERGLPARGEPRRGGGHAVRVQGRLHGQPRQRGRLLVPPHRRHAHQPRLHQRVQRHLPVLLPLRRVDDGQRAVRIGGAVPDEERVLLRGRGVVRRVRVALLVRRQGRDPVPAEVQGAARGAARGDQQGELQGE